MALTKIDDRGLKTPIDLLDNEKIRFGTGNDFEIVHDGSNSYIQEDGTGQIIIRGWSPRIQTGYSPTSGRNTGENSIVCITDGAVELYYDNSKKFETTSAGVSVTGDFQLNGANYNVKWENANNKLIFNDNARAVFGTGTDLIIKHDGTTNWIDSVANHTLIVRAGTGDAYLQAQNIYLGDEGANEKYIDCHKDGAVELYYNNALKFETNPNGCLLSDDVKLQLGGNADLKLYHNGSTSLIEDTIGDLRIRSDGLKLQAANGENYVHCTANGAVQLYYNNTKQVETYDGGITLNGHLKIPDSKIIRIGTSTNGDLKIFHDSINSYLDNVTGSLHLRVNNTENAVVAAPNGSVYLYYDASEKFKTANTGCEVTGVLSFNSGTSGGTIKLQDDQKIFLGGGDDLQIYHDGSNSYIKDNGTGHLKLDTEVEITGESKGVCTHNLIQNGAMILSERAHYQSNYTGNSGYHIDRWKMTSNGTDEHATMEKHDLTSSDTGPWGEGFKYSLLVRNGNQTSGAGVNDYISVFQVIEARNMRHSGWDYGNTSSYVTLSFWIKSSVAQAFSGMLRSLDGTAKRWPFTTGSLSADTWTKVTKTVPGHADLQFDENNGAGLQVYIVPFWGTGYTSPGTTYDAWANWSDGSRSQDYTTTWYTTNNATLEITGVQLERGKVANDYKHQSFHDIKLECKRYYQIVRGSSSTFSPCIPGTYNTDTEIVTYYTFPVEMRGNPSFGYGTALSNFDFEGWDDQPNNLSLRGSTSQGCGINSTGNTSRTRGHAALLTIDQSAGYVEFKNEY